ncbi:hypothetical protein L198_00175 [Cryptococcus wingfieldii CBS 7118]|uniref:Uncharacterized protein n=1 Tax=Cryptococcus wingfieldii CBS 7118 TaxID=1295528 RepID=A0A1E3K601_9TREE|nr:hypothetical protein L198_00175 [Cryptococcus wingfieldii CBS 7118]ODO08445.1 hypothetical protein L198_00175 [Cryptococcus wingfieldii CBS 7118]
MRSSRPLVLLRRPQTLPLRPLLRRPLSSVPPTRNINHRTNEYTDSTIYAFSYLSRTIKYVLISLVGIGATGLIGFEGLHFWVEKVGMGAPSREDSGIDGVWGWDGEHQGWTGGPKGGTDPRLGFKARHALRAAWISQEWGAGSSASIEKGMHTSAFHPDYVAARSIITRTQADQAGGGVRKRVDRGYEIADEYVDLAIKEAKKKGLVFPPELSGARASGPTFDNDGYKGLHGDPAAMDLLLLKAGVLERINTFDSLAHAKDVYEQVLSSLSSSALAPGSVSPGGQAKVMRLASKVGDLCARTGSRDEATKWWSWGLGHVGIDVQRKVVGQVEGKPAAGVKDLPPPVLRATIALITSASAQLATTSSLQAASELQALGLTYLTPPPLIPANQTPAAELHWTWLTQRSSLLKLHLSSVLYALQKTNPRSLPLLAEAKEEAEEVIADINPMPKEYLDKSKATTPAAKLLARDALLTGAEIAFTRGLLLERTVSPAASTSSSWSIPFFSSLTTSSASKLRPTTLTTLQAAQKEFQRATALSLLESGADKRKKGPKEEGQEEAVVVGRGEEWAKYNRSLERVNGKIDELLGVGQGAEVKEEVQKV